MERLAQSTYVAVPDPVKSFAAVSQVTIKKPVSGLIKHCKHNRVTHHPVHVTLLSVRYDITMSRVVDEAHKSRFLPTDGSGSNGP